MSVLGKRPSALFLGGSTNKRQSMTERKLVDINGHIEVLLYPASRELYSGFAVVQINGQKVVGRLPFIDFYFVYHLRCEVTSGYQGNEYKIVDFNDPPFEPFKLSFITLSSMLVSMLGYPKTNADRKVSRIRQRLKSVGSTFAEFDPDWLLRSVDPLPQWLITLSHASLLFKYKQVISLQYLWTSDKLSKLTVEELARVSDLLPDEVFSFCFYWKNDFSLPELSLETVKRYIESVGFTLSPEQCAAIACYGRLKTWIKKHGQFSITYDALSSWIEHVPFLIKNKIITATYVEYRGNPTRRYFLCPDLCLIKECMGRLNAFFDKPTLAPKRRTTVPSNLEILNREQRACYDAISSQNLVIVLGDAGTGKTLLGEYIYRTYKVGDVLPVAYFGKVAANLKNIYGAGMTIHKLDAEILHDTDLGKKLKEKVEILIIDEGSTLTLKLLNTALKVLPKLKKLIILGDEKQMSPPSRGPVFEALVEFYMGTPAVHRLVEVKRTDDPTGILKSNFDKIIAGRTDLDIALTLDTCVCTVDDKDVDDVTVDSGIPMWMFEQLLTLNEVQEITVASGKTIIHISGPTQNVETVLRNEEYHYTLENHPFILLQRVVITKEEQTKNAYTEQRISKLQTSLRRVLRYYDDVAVYHIITQTNKVRQDLNHAVFLETRPDNRYTHNIFLVGEKIMFRENDYGSASNREGFAKHVRSSPIMNGEVVEIRKIIDISPYGKPEAAEAKSIELISTHVPKQVPHWHRLLILDDGRQINLSHYSIANIVKGTVSTIASEIGAEHEVVVLYVHDGFSLYLTRKVIYTAMTRARRRVIVICAFDENNPQHSELIQIIQNNPEPPECVFGFWLKPWKQAPIQAVIAGESSDESAEGM